MNSLLSCNSLLATCTLSPLNSHLSPLTSHRNPKPYPNPHPVLNPTPTPVSPSVPFNLFTFHDGVDELIEQYGHLDISS